MFFSFVRTILIAISLTSNPIAEPNLQPDNPKQEIGYIEKSSIIPEGSLSQAKPRSSRDESATHSTDEIHYDESLRPNHYPIADPKLRPILSKRQNDIIYKTPYNPKGSLEQYQYDNVLDATDSSSKGAGANDGAIVLLSIITAVVLALIAFCSIFLTIVNLRINITEQIRHEIAYTPNSSDSKLVSEILKKTNTTLRKIGRNIEAIKKLIDDKQ